MPNILYNGTHSIQITVNGTNYNTWTSWGLIPASRPFVSIPQPKLNIISIPGTNDLLDLTDLTPGGLTFGERSGEWIFIIDYEKWSNWVSPVDSIRNTIHGKKVTVRLVDDPTKEYTGRMYVSGYSPGPNYSTITLSYVFASGYTDNTSSIVDPSQGGWQGGGSGGDSGNGGSSSGGGSGGGSSDYSSDPNGMPEGYSLVSTSYGKPSTDSYSRIKGLNRLYYYKIQESYGSYSLSNNTKIDFYITIYGDNNEKYIYFYAYDDDEVYNTYGGFISSNEGYRYVHTSLPSDSSSHTILRLGIACLEDNYSQANNIRFYIYCKYR